MKKENRAYLRGDFRKIWDKFAFLLFYQNSSSNYKNVSSINPYLIKLKALKTKNIHYWHQLAFATVFTRIIRLVLFKFSIILNICQGIALFS